MKKFFYECKNIFIMRLYLSCDIATWFSHDQNENFWLMKVKFRSTQYDVLNGCEQNLEIMIYSFFIILSFLYFWSWINHLNNSHGRSSSNAIFLRNFQIITWYTYDCNREMTVVPWPTMTCHDVSICLIQLDSLLDLLDLLTLFFQFFLI